jgi:DNA-binding CsgD family transcriptional regulator
VQQALFERYVITEKGCWEWTGGKSHGYGQLRVREVWADDPVYAHRVSYLIHHDPIPFGQEVCHTCDNHPCFNPEHLFLGDQAANIRDMVAKGRGAHGAKNGMARLAADDIAKMRELSAGGRKQSEIAKIYGISEGHLSDILRGKRWRRGPGGIRTHHGLAKVTEKDVYRMHDLFAQGMNYADISRQFDVADATVRDAILGNTWKSVFAARRQSSDLT